MIRLKALHSDIWRWHFCLHMCVCVYVRACVHVCVQLRLSLQPLCVCGTFGSEPRVCVGCFQGEMSRFNELVTVSVSAYVCVCVCVWECVSWSPHSSVWIVIYPSVHVHTHIWSSNITWCQGSRVCEFTGTLRLHLCLDCRVTSSLCDACNTCKNMM